MRIPEDSADAPATLPSDASLDVQARLCGQIGHDVSNLLGVISNFAQFLQREITDDRARGDLDMLRAATDQAVALNRSLLTFAGRITTNPVDGDLGQMVRDCLPVLEEQVAGRATLAARLSSDALPVSLDPDQLGAILGKLVANALEASSSSSEAPATITITTAALTLDCAPRATASVSDNGEGMSEQTLARAVEPFFTTRPRRIGSGLGLSVVHGLAQVNEGTLTITSALGEGTTATVALPLSR